MPESRDGQIMINLEITFLGLVRQVLKTYNISASSYARKLILRDLLEKGLLNAEILLQVTTTDSIEELQDSVLERVNGHTLHITSGGTTTNAKSQPEHQVHNVPN